RGGGDGDGRDLVGGAGVVFVPRDQELRALGGERGGSQDHRHLRGQPGVALGDRAVVHVVAAVGRDERVARRAGGSCKVRRQLRVRHHVAGAAGGVVAN